MKKRVFAESSFGLFLLFPLVGGLALAAEKVHLGYHLQPDLEYKCKVKFTRELEYRGYFFSSLVQLELTVRCAKTDGDSLFRMEADIDKIGLTVKREDEILENDWEDQLNGKTLIFQMTPTGEVDEVDCTGYVEDWKEVKSVLGTVLNSLFPLLPDEEVEVGAEVAVESQRRMGKGRTGGVEGKGKLKLEKFEKKGGYRCVKVKGRITDYVHGRIEGEMGHAVFDGEGEEKVEFYFDPEARLAREVKRELDIDLTFIPVDDSAAGERKVEEAGMLISFKMEPR